MDIQLLLRLDRMAQPRTLILQADFAGAQRLAAQGLIEVSYQKCSVKPPACPNAVLVHVITEKGKLAIALERARPNSERSRT